MPEADVIVAWGLLLGQGVREAPPGWAWREGVCGPDAGAGRLQGEQRQRGHRASVGDGAPTCSQRGPLNQVGFTAPVREPRLRPWAFCPQDHPLPCPCHLLPTAMRTGLAQMLGLQSSFGEVGGVGECH